MRKEVLLGGVEVFGGQRCPSWMSQQRTRPPAAEPNGTGQAGAHQNQNQDPAESERSSIPLMGSCGSSRGASRTQRSQPGLQQNQDGMTHPSGTGSSPKRTTLILTLPASLCG